MLRIERQSKGKSIHIKLSGRLQADRLPELTGEIEKCKRLPNLDLEAVALLDRESVRYFMRCESNGIQLVNCPLYIQEWIATEKEQTAS